MFRRRQWHLTPVLLPGKSHGRRSLEGCSPCGRWGSGTRLRDFTFTFHFHALEKEIATHSSVLAWRIPGTGEPGGLPSMGSHRVGHDWSDLAVAVYTYICTYIYIYIYIYMHRKRRGERCSKLLPIVISGYVYRWERVFCILFLHFLSAISLQLEHVNVSHPSF